MGVEGGEGGEDGLGKLEVVIFQQFHDLRGSTSYKRAARNFGEIDSSAGEAPPVPSR